MFLRKGKENARPSGSNALLSLPFIIHLKERVYNFVNQDKSCECVKAVLNSFLLYQHLH